MPPSSVMFQRVCAERFKASEKNMADKAKENFIQTVCGNIKSAQSKILKRMTEKLNLETSNFQMSPKTKRRVVHAPWIVSIEIYFNFASVFFTASKFGKSFGVGVCS